MQNRIALVGLLWAAVWAGVSFAQNTVALDYGLYLADFDIDPTGEGVATGFSISGTWGDRQQSIQAAGASFALDRSVKFSGLRSQAIQIQRSAGSAGRLTIRFDPITETRYILPPEGTPVLVRIAYRVENIQNLSYRFFYRTGERWGTLLQSTGTPTNGWQIISQVVPIESDTNGNRFLRLYLEISIGDGAAQGRFWLDGVQAIAQPITIPARTRPNGIKTATFGGVDSSEWAQFVETPLEFALLRHDSLHAVRQLPNMPKGLLYLNPYKSFARQSAQWLDDLYDYYDANANHPDWFLLDTNGNRIQDVRYPEQNAYFMDIGNTQAQQRLAERLILLTRERSIVPEWIFLDNWSDWNQSQQYPTRASMMPAWSSLLNRIAPVIRDQLGARLVINIGSRIAIFLDNNPGVQWLSQVDGIMQEGAFIIYNSQTREYTYRNYAPSRTPVSMVDSSWLSTLRAVTSFPDKYWFLLVQCDPNNPEMFHFAVASYLVMANEKTILSFDARGNDGVDAYRTFKLRPELFIPLGAPVSSYRVEQGQLNTGALFARDFQYGLVLVNPHPELSFQYRTTRAYKDWDGNIVPANTLLTIGPRRGVVLYAAPEIVINLSPQQITALPGDTVTFTVQYRNDGLADATNVKISVPLPEGLEFVSSSTGGQYLDRRITWTLPQVRTGQSGTLTFQARVQ